jgi:precorrin-2 dehydrogenase/sirohydrochlorin ferrochelatase
MRSLAANLDLRGRGALLIGAGAVGRRKLDSLLGTGASVTVVEPDPAPWLQGLSDKGRVSLRRSFSPDLLDHSPLVFVAAGSGPAMDIASQAMGRGLWVNMAGSPEKGNFTLPALAEDGPFRLAVSTGGSSPALSAHLARGLREEYRGYGAFCVFLKRARRLALESGMGEPERRGLFSRLAEDRELPRLIREGSLSEAYALARRLAAPLPLPEDILQGLSEAGG